MCAARRVSRACNQISGMPMSAASRPPISPHVNRVSNAVDTRAATIDIHPPTLAVPGRQSRISLNPGSITDEGWGASAWSQGIPRLNLWGAAPTQGLDVFTSRSRCGIAGELGHPHSACVGVGLVGFRRRVEHRVSRQGGARHGPGRCSAGGGQSDNGGGEVHTGHRTEVGGTKAEHSAIFGY